MVSVEIYPPNNVATLAGLHGIDYSFLNIAFKKEFATLLKTVENLKNSEGDPARLIPHMIGNKFTKSEVFDMVQQLEQQGVRKLLACRGDGQVLGDFPNSLPLTKFIQDEFSNVEVFSTIYTEPYDWNMLKRKHDLGVRDYVCQMSFDTYRQLKLHDKFQQLLPGSRLHMGIMVLKKKASLNLVLDNNWVPVPPAIRHLTADALEKHGPEITAQQIRDLQENGIDNIHLYSWNNWEATEEVLALI